MKLFLKNLIPVLAIVCLIFPSCALEMSDPIINGFTHEVTLVTEAGEVGASTNSAYTSDYLSAYFTIKAGNNYFLHLSVDGNHDHRGSFTLKKGDKLYLKLKDGNLLTFENPEDITASDVLTRARYYTLEYWDAVMVYAISYDDLLRIAKSDFVGARVETDMGNMDFSMSSGESKSLKKLAQLAINAGNGG